MVWPSTLRIPRSSTTDRARRWSRLLGRAMQGALLLSVGVVLQASSTAQSVLVEPDQDTSIYEDDPAVQLSNGQGVRCHFGTNQIGQRRRFLVRFDLEGVVPAGSVVTQARLRLHVFNFSPGSDFNMEQHVHRMVRAWGEGASNAGFPGGAGALAQPGDASWFMAFVPGMPWLQPGGDFTAQPSAITQHNTIGTIFFASPQMLEDVRGWVANPASNHGWLIKDSTEAPNTAFVFASRQDPSPMLRPTLELTFAPMPVNITPFCEPAATNSSGQVGKLEGIFNAPSGTGLHLDATGGPPGQFAYFLVGSQVQNPGIVIADGTLCLGAGVGSSIGRYILAGTDRNSVGQFDGAGVLQNLVGTAAVGTGFDVPTILPTTGDPVIAVGSTWHFQLWYRDGMSSNLTSGLSVTF